MLSKIKIGKKEWGMRLEQSDAMDGFYGGLDEENSNILIFDCPEHNDPIKLFGTGLHEMLHARNPKMSERAVLDTERAAMEWAAYVFGYPYKEEK